MSNFNVFVSYTKEDSPIAIHIKKFIENINGELKVFIAEEDIYGSQEWRSAIQENLINCKIIVPIITHRSVHTQWLSCEAGYFWVSGKDILAIAEHKNIHAEIPSFVKPKQVLFFDDKKLFYKIATSLFKVFKLGTPPRESALNYTEYNDLLSDIAKKTRGPAETVLEWNNALDEGNIEKAKMLTSRESETYIKSRDDWGNSIEGLSEKYRKSKRAHEVIDFVKYGNNIAIVGYYCLYPDKEVGKNKTRWTDATIREDGIWKIMPQYVHSESS